ncbi:MAG: hypothetical protein A3A33_02425 [Candidatus Yanofskybacteria bacterium RIFCSPLOWO2_01_FULL_49_25]|uniref:Restriction endonuclease subunit R n=1 Tax=Candidatus Yanofskybacteria bacterium RIFCSPLOWO2_01_FULL_49_25 TaxID=1802701 RepID=A0A1F8GU84_9BACT|nr:MAG: hypothetical protein A3A33_02425 [Candidatus Yanofskybacteria bacterium RIFCSPLOWO2_01_FULL_49_25]
MIMLDEHQLQVFMMLFRGRTDVYARRWEKEGRSGYSPAYAFDWNEFMAHKRQGGTMKDFENKRLMPLTDDTVKKHLMGEHVIGIYPILPDNTSYFLAADFDGETWIEDARAYLRECTDARLSAYLERSRSGNGGHVWIFFAEAYPCYKSRQIGLELIRRTFSISEFEKEVSFDRLFPNQDTLTKLGFGNLIALPLQGQSVSRGNTVFIDPATGTQDPNQWSFIGRVRRHAAEELDIIRERLLDKNNPHTQRTSDILTIAVGHQLMLQRAQLAPELIAFLKEELNFLNSDYLTKQRLGKPTYKLHKYFKLIDETADAILIPRGFLNQLVSFLTQHNILYIVQKEFLIPDQISFSNAIELTPTQKDIVEKALQHDQGVIVAPSGSGKTIIGLELIARRKLPALILVHRKQLLDQWIERIQQFLDIPKKHIGQFSGTKKKTGKHITVGLLQSLARKKDLSELQNQFGIIIVDECHHIPASTFREVVAQLNSKYLYGLTATPKRKNNDEKLIYAYIGDIIAELKETTAQPSGPPLPPRIIIQETNLAIPFKFKTDQFELLAKIVCFDTARNQMIVQNIINQASDNKKVLVLSERKEHLEILNLYLKGKCETIVISGDDSAPKRKSKLKQIETGHYQAILSTGQFFGEGLDVRGMTCLILAFPFSFEGKLIQYIGRLRDSGAQKTIIDYRDRKIPFLERQFKQRERYYEKLKASFVENTEIPF